MRNQNSKGGFTIAEVLIAIVVVALTIASITFLVVDTINANSANLKQFVASQLAQEGIEVTRNMRDSNWMRNLDWFGSQAQPDGSGVYVSTFEKNAEGATGDSVKGNVYIVDHKPAYPARIGENALQDYHQSLPWEIKKIGKLGKLEQSKLEENSRLYLCDEPRDPLYVHDADAWGCKDPSLYNRYIVIEPYTLSEFDKSEVKMVRVRSIVEWNHPNGKKRVELVEEMTDWRRSAL